MPRIASALNRSSRAAVKSRQLEIEQCLARYGLSGGPRRLFGVGADSAAAEDHHSLRLRSALTSLGPVFSSFGRYLSSRVDLLPAECCLELAALPERVPPIPIASIRELIAGSLGCMPEEAYLEIEEEPFESRLAFQSHHGLLADGTEATIKLARVGLEEHSALDVELLPMLRGAFVFRKLTGPQIEDAASDFKRSLEEQMDFARETEALETLACDSKEFEMLKAPRLHRNLCSRTVLTIERLHGSTLSDVIAHLNAPEASGDNRARGVLELGVDRSHLASRLYRVWLRQSLMGSRFPVEPSPENILLLPDRQIAFTGSQFASLEPEAKSNLLAYLTAASAEDPDRAGSSLIREMGNAGQRSREEELRQRFRQIVPFRDGGWSMTGDCDSVAERMFVQWRIAGECGFQPLAHLVSFHRGLFLIAAAVRQLSPERDPLPREIEEVRLMELLGQFEDIVGLRQLGNNLDRYAGMMMDLPRKLDEVLTLAAEGGARVRLRVTESANQRGQKNSLAVVIALLLVLASVALLSHRLAAVSAVWGEPAGAILFVVIGALLLRAASTWR